MQGGVASHSQTDRVRVGWMTGRRRGVSFVSGNTGRSKIAFAGWRKWRDDGAWGRPVPALSYLEGPSLDSPWDLISLFPFFKGCTRHSGVTHTVPAHAPAHEPA